MECELTLWKPQCWRAVVIPRALYLQMLLPMFIQAINRPLNPEDRALVSILETEVYNQGGSGLPVTKSNWLIVLHILK